MNLHREPSHRFLNRIGRYALWLLIVAGAFPLPAQQPLIEVAASVDRTQITVGDPIRYLLEIEIADATQLREPVRGTSIGAFEVLAFRSYPPENREGRTLHRYAFSISVYDTGAYIIPSYPVAYLPPDSTGEYRIITAEPLEIFVHSVIEADDPELKDIRPPFGLPQNRWWLWAIVAAALLGLAWWYFFFRKKTGKVQPRFRKEIIRPAHEIALEELQQLLGTNLLAQNKHKPFYSILSEILRRYIEGRFYIAALEETTAELSDSLHRIQMSNNLLDKAVEALQDCDMVKFAKHIPASAETDHTVTRVRQFIEETRLEFKAVETVERLADATTEEKPAP